MGELVYVLCVCFGNTCRSPMMEWLLALFLGPRYKVESAGIRFGCGGQRANQESIRCMKERRMDISGHISRCADDLDLMKYKYIVCVGPQEVDAIARLLDGKTGPKILIANKEAGGVPNPYEKGPAAYDECINTLVRTLPTTAETIRAS